MVRWLGVECGEQVEGDSVDAALVVGQGDRADTGGRHESDERAEAAGTAVVPEEEVVAPERHL